MAAGVGPAVGRALARATVGATISASVRAATQLHRQPATVSSTVGTAIGSTVSAAIGPTIGASVRAAVGRAFLGRRRHVVIVERHELLPRSSKATPERARETVLPDDHSRNQSYLGPKSATLDRWTRSRC